VVLSRKKKTPTKWLKPTRLLLTSGSNHNTPYNIVYSPAFAGLFYVPSNRIKMMLLLRRTLVLQNLNSANKNLTSQKFKNSISKL